MSTEENKRIANQIVKELFTNKNVAYLDQVIKKDAIEHAAPPGMPETVESTKQFVSGLLRAFPDIKYRVNFLVAEGDKVVQYVTGAGTMKGDFMGMPAANKQATWDEVHILRFENDMVAEHWAIVDQVSMLTQLGFIQASEMQSKS